jgi:hypothetical protein
MPLLLLGTGLAAATPLVPWWQPGSNAIFPAQQDFPDAAGSLRVLRQGGPLDTTKHPFFTAIGSNGRACVTCHQPANGMSLSAAAALERWNTYGSKDPLFAAFDGSNCPDLPQQDAASHSLLLNKGLIRIARAWPPVDVFGKPVQPDFKIDVVRDPTGCNTSPKWGLASPHPSVSVFRRPRMVANLKYILAVGFDYDPKSGLPLPLDPLTNTPVSHNLMADGRMLTLQTQMADAGSSHLAMLEKLSADDIGRINQFELSVFAAQQTDRIGGQVDDGGATGGPKVLADSPPGRLGSRGVKVASEFDPWANAAQEPGLSPEERDFRESVARGAKIFREKTFLITDTMGINAPIGFGNPVRNSCVFCHNMSRIGMDVAPGQVDLGTTTLPFADPQPDLPVFRITCLGPPHPFYGQVIYTHDPGYALTTGRCADVGRITLQSLRGLSARAPYFSNGSAKDLGGVIDYYDRRYNIGYTKQERQDLINLMSVF